MPPFSRWARRLGLLLTRGRVERRMLDEMRHHVECEAAERVRAGMAPAEARRTALRDFGGLERWREEGRDARGTRLAEDAVRDAGHAFRRLRRAPGAALASVLTLALGIGAATAIFSVVYGVLFRPLPYRDPARLVVLWSRNEARGADRNVVSVGDLDAWRTRLRSLEGVGAVVPRPVTVTTGGAPERVPGAEVTPGWFALLGVHPALGREFAAREGEEGQGNVVIVSDGFWRARLGADPEVLGRTLAIAGTRYAIVGVMPPSFEPPRLGWLGEQELWFPFAATAQSRQWGRFLLVLARVRQGTTIAQARAELASLTRELAASVPDDRGWGSTVVGLTEQVTGDVRPALLVLLGAVGLLLVMAVTNVGALTLAQLRRREHELAVRRAIGAGTGRLVRQELAGSAVVAGIGGAAGLGLSVIGVRLLVRLLPEDLPRLSAVRVDAPALLFVSALVVLSTLAIGAVAARRAARDGRRAHPGAGAPGRSTAAPGGSALVVAEVALGLVLTACAGMMARSFVALRAVDLGFSADHVVSARVALPTDRYPTPERQRAFFEALTARLRATPDVRAAGLVSGRPLGGIGPATGFGDPARGGVLPGGALVADVRYADAGYFRAMRIPLVAGEAFDARDAGGLDSAPPRAIVSREAVRALWPTSEVAGRPIALDLYGGIRPTIAGVVGDVHLTDPRTAPRPLIYLSASRWPDVARDVVVRGEGDPAALVGAMRAAVRALDPGLPLFRVARLDEVVAASLARDRAITVLLAAFALSALLLAGVGTFGVFAGDVVRRRAEIGIRVALGARRSGVVLLVMRRAMTRAEAGAALGVVAALLPARAMTPLLFGVNATDPLALGVVAAVLLAVAALASWIPARRAAAMDPAMALRAE